MRWVLLGAVALLLIVAAPAEAADACGGEVSCDASDPPKGAPVTGPPENPCDPMCIESRG